MRKMIYLLWLGFFACGEEEQGGYGKKWKPQIPAMFVKTELVQLGDVSNYLEVTGILEGVEQASIIPETTGIVKKIYVREGDVVQKGTVLAQLINPNLSESFERSEIEIDRLRREFLKTKVLYEQGAISDREYQEAGSALQTARSSNAEAKASAAKLIVTSPIFGVVASVGIREGEVASATQLFQIVNPEKLRVVVSIPEKDLQVLKEGQTVLIRPSYDEEAVVSAVIERISPVVNATSGTVDVFITLEEGQTVLRPGQFVKGQIEVDTHASVMVIPKTALIYNDGDPMAFVVIDAPEPEEEEKSEDEEEVKDEDAEDEGMKRSKPAPFIADQRELGLGYSDAEWVEITAGLEIGEKVVTIGNANLENETPIILEAPKIEKKSDKEEDGDKKEDKVQ
jgi:membrane fusion protein, multidrug efflux system